MTTFESLNLSEKMHAALKRMGYTVPTAIQAQAIPHALQGRDILGSARTGTGKTAAFSIPMIARLSEDPNAMALVLAPTRELAAQTLDVVQQLTGGDRTMGTALLIGGDSMGKQFEQLRRNPRIIIGTPGRINDHLRRNPKLLSRVVVIALDEADRMLDMGFSDQIDDIFQTIPSGRQMLMFSATFPDSIIKFSRKYLNNPERVSVGTEKIDAPKINHEVKRTSDHDKYTDLLAELTARDGSVIVFVKTQHGTERLAKRLEADEHVNVVIHGGLRQSQRERAVKAFRNQRARIMVATDVAARGLDIPHIEHVINYDLPQVAEDYIHRIGRTGRAGATGHAMAFVTPSETGKWNAINRILNPGEAPMRGERSAAPARRPNGGGQGRGPQKSWGDRPRSGANSNAAPGQRKPFEKRSDSRDWNRDRPAYGDRPERSERSDRSYSGRSGSERPNFDRPQSERPRSDRPRSDRLYSDRPRSERPVSDRPRRDDDRSRDAKPFTRGDGSSAPRKAPTDRNWNNKDDRGSYTRPKEYKPDWREQGRGDGRMDNRIGDAKPKREKAAAPTKKPFKFKEHSRKTTRPEGRSGGSRQAV